MSTASTVTRPKILLLGDSLTQLSFSASLAGWGARLADEYQRRADVINRGMSGYNTDWYLRYASPQQSDIFVLTGVKLITIFFGANDSSCSELNPHHHVPVDRYKTNLKQLIQLCQKHYPDAAILVIGCPPVDHEQRLVYQKERYGPDATGELERNMELSETYASAAQDVAEECKLPCLNLWKEFQNATKDWSRFLNDGLHFSRQGNEFVGKAIVQKIRQEFPDLAVTPCELTGQYANSASFCPALRQSGPYHDEINHEEPEGAFTEE